MCFCPYLSESDWIKLFLLNKVSDYIFCTRDTSRVAECQSLGLGLQYLVRYANIFVLIDSENNKFLKK